jgi:hypothetical protein
MNDIDDRLISLALTAFTLVVSGVVWADMYSNGALSALPRAAGTLAFFALFRWIIGRSARTPDGTDDADNTEDTAPAPAPAPAPVSPPLASWLLDRQRAERSVSSSAVPPART